MNFETFKTTVISIFCDCNCTLAYFPWMALLIKIKKNELTTYITRAIYKLYTTSSTFDPHAKVVYRELIN